MSSTRGCPTARQLKLLCLSELKRGAWGFGALEGMKTIHRKMERVKVWQTNACRAKQRQWDREASEQTGTAKPCPAPPTTPTAIPYSSLRWQLSFWTRLSISRLFQAVEGEVQALPESSGFHCCRLHIVHMPKWHIMGKLFLNTFNYMYTHLFAWAAPSVVR